jgi:hypothetical protein
MGMCYTSNLASSLKHVRKGKVHVSYDGNQIRIEAKMGCNQIKIKAKKEGNRISIKAKK